MQSNRKSFAKNFLKIGCVKQLWNMNLRKKINKIVTSPLHESRLHWIHDPNPHQSRHVESKSTVPRTNNNSVPRNNNDTVPKNNNNSDASARNPLESIPSTTWYNSNLPLPSVSSRGNVSTHTHPVPRNNNHENPKNTQVHNNANCSSPPPKKKRDRKHRRERRAREKKEEKLLFMMRAGPISKSDPVNP